MQDRYTAGIDIGSTTVKLVICNPEGKAIFSRYRRHHSRTLETLRTMLEEVLSDLGDVNITAAFTGSAGMGLAESYGFPFIQEVVASSQLIRYRWPEVKTFVRPSGGGHIIQRKASGKKSNVGWRSARILPRIAACLNGSSRTT
ncbi:MAG: hypothetical protein ABFD66_15305 [Smithella sp.]